MGCFLVGCVRKGCPNNNACPKVLQAIFWAGLQGVPVNERFRAGAAATADACSRFGQLEAVDECHSTELVQTPGLLRLVLRRKAQTDTGSALRRRWAAAKAAQSRAKGPLLSPVPKISGDRIPSSGDNENYMRQ